MFVVFICFIWFCFVSRESNRSSIVFRFSHSFVIVLFDCFDGFSFLLRANFILCVPNILLIGFDSPTPRASIHPLSFALVLIFETDLPVNFSLIRLQSFEFISLKFYNKHTHLEDTWHSTESSESHTHFPIRNNIDNNNNKQNYEP